jgi:hypothetical protein
MEPITIFAVSVGLVGACRLTFVAADFLGKGIYSKGNKPASCDNWYCYFKTSDLWGSKKQQKRSPVDVHQQQRRQQQRPRPRPEGGFH